MGRSRNRERVNNRKAFQHIKDRPDIPRPSNAKRVRKEWLVEIRPRTDKEHADWFLRNHPPGIWRRWGKYETEEGAEQAKKQHQTQYYYGDHFEYRVRHEKDSDE